MGSEGECPLCNGIPEYFKRDAPSRDVFCVKCRRCGRFNITPQALMVLRQEHKPGLSSVCRRASSDKGVIEILSTNIEQLLKSLPHYSPPEKLDNLLQQMAEMTPALGQYTQFNRDVDYLMRELLGREYLKGTHDGVALTMSGWEHLEEIKQRGRASSRCFVAMWLR